MIYLRSRIKQEKDDELKGTEDDIQKLTDKYVGIIDATVEEKTKEILTV